MHRILPDSGVHGATLPLDIAWETDVYRKQPGHIILIRTPGSRCKQIRRRLTLFIRDRTLLSFRADLTYTSLDVPILVALVEDQAHTREGLASLIGGSPGFEVTGQYGSMEDALPALERVTPDVFLADIGLPGMSGIEGVRLIHLRFPELPY